MHRRQESSGCARREGRRLAIQDADIDEPCSSPSRAATVSRRARHPARASQPPARRTGFAGAGRRYRRLLSAASRLGLCRICFTAPARPVGVGRWWTSRHESRLGLAPKGLGLIRGRGGRRGGLVQASASSAAGSGLAMFMMASGRMESGTDNVCVGCAVWIIACRVCRPRTVGSCSRGGRVVGERAGQTGVVGAGGAVGMMWRVCRMGWAALGPVGHSARLACERCGGNGLTGGGGGCRRLQDGRRRRIRGRVQGLQKAWARWACRGRGGVVETVCAVLTL